MAYRLDRQEIAGSLGDLGTILPLAIGMVIINGLNPLGIFLSVGIFYVLSGLYFGVTLSVEPMKVISAYAIATGIPVLQLTTSGLLIGIILLIIGGSDAPGPISGRGADLMSEVLSLRGISVEHIDGDILIEGLTNHHS